MKTAGRHYLLSVHLETRPWVLMRRARVTKVHYTLPPYSTSVDSQSKLLLISFGWILLFYALAHDTCLNTVTFCASIIKPRSVWLVNVWKTFMIVFQVFLWEVSWQIQNYFLTVKILLNAYKHFSKPCCIVDLNLFTVSFPICRIYSGKYI